MMSRRLSHDEKETAIENVRAHGTLIAGANAAGVTYQTIRNEMRRSPIFAKRIRTAQEDGVSEIGNTAIENIQRIASEVYNLKDIRSRLTANIALANFAVPGFRGESKVSGRIEHDIKVVSGIPRPVYNVKALPVEDKEKVVKEIPLLTAGKQTNVL